MLDRLELVCAQITELERERDAVLEEEVPDKAEEMIQQLVGLRGIGAQSATVLGPGGVRARIRQRCKGARLLRWAQPRTPFSSGGNSSGSKGSTRLAIDGCEP